MMDQKLFVLRQPLGDYWTSASELKLKLRVFCNVEMQIHWS